MITITIDGQDFKIANSYEELSLGQYVDIMKLSDKKIENSNESDIEMICALSDRPEELKPLIWKFSVDDFNQLTELFNWVADSSVLDDIKKLKSKEKLIVDGQEYGVITDFNKQMTLSEIISFETLLKQKHSDNHRLEIAFGVLIRPIIDGKLAEFTESTFNDVIKNKYKVNMIDVYSVIVFFSNGGTKSTTKSTKAFSIRQS